MGGHHEHYVGLAVYPRDFPPSQAEIGPAETTHELDMQSKEVRGLVGAFGDEFSAMSTSPRRPTHQERPLNS
jgi:hypothetical protein